MLKVRPFILLVLLMACSAPEKDKTVTPEKKADPDEMLVSGLDTYENFRKAKPYWGLSGINFDSASVYYQKLLQEPLNPDEKLFIINRLIYIYYAQKQLSNASQLLRKGISLAGRISNDYLWMMGYAYDMMGKIHSDNSQPDSALFYFLEANRFYEKAGSKYDRHKYLCLEHIAHEYRWMLEDYINAEKYYLLARNLLEKNAGGIKNRDSMLFKISYDMSSIYRLKGELDKALAYAYQARTLADSFNLKRGKEITIALLSNIYRDSTNWAKARLLNLEAIDMNGSRGGTRIDRAIYFNNMAFLSIKLKQYQEAEDYCRKTFQLLDQILSDAGLNRQVLHSLHDQNDLDLISHRISNQSLLLQVLEEMAICYEFSGSISEATGNPEKAYQNYKKCLLMRRIRFGDFHKQVSQIYHQIGNYFVQINLPDSALINYQKSLISGSVNFNNPETSVNPTLSQIENNVGLIEVLRDKASLLKLAYETDPRNQAALVRSLDCLRLCDSLIGFVWDSYTNDDSRLFLEDLIHPIYEQAIEAAFKLYQIDKSTDYLTDIYHFMENSRYRVLSDNLTSLQAYAQAKIPADLSGKLREVEFFIKYYSRQKNEVPEKSGYFNTQLYEKIRQKEMLMDSIERDYPRVLGIKGLLESVTLESVNAKIRNTGSLLIQFFSGGKHFFILSSDGNKTGVRMVAKDSLLQGSLKALLGLPSADPVSRSGYIRFAVHSVDLYEKLLKPSLGDYPDNPVNNLIIIPDEKLNLISFDALVRSMPDTAFVNYQAPDYLVNHYSISYAFSSGILVSEKPPAQSGRRNRVLAMSYGTEGSDTGEPLAGLSWANRELDAIQGKFSGRFLKDREATESNFKKYAPDYQIIHLSLHGQAGAGLNDSTMLIFRKPPDEPEDGFLLPDELYSINLNARLVVLSSCESGTGMIFKGEGIYSMARAFTHAGCPTLIATLWQIPDKYTVPVMAGFYSGLKIKMTAGQALRKSKLDYLASAGQYSSHPRYWASFIPLGEMVSF